MKFIKFISIVIVFIISGFVMASDSNVYDDHDDNWCYEGRPWGDGRCNNVDSNIQEYNWKVGWCMAQVENGTLSATFYECMGIPELVLTFEFTFPESDSDMSEDECFDTCDTNEDGGMSEGDFEVPNDDVNECIDNEETNVPGDCGIPDEEGVFDEEAEAEGGN